MFFYCLEKNHTSTILAHTHDTGIINEFTQKLKFKTKNAFVTVYNKTGNSLVFGTLKGNDTLQKNNGRVRYG